VLLGPATVVRLERTLAHSSSPAVGISAPRSECDAPEGNWVPERAGVNLLKLRPPGPVVKPGEVRSRNGANGRVSRIPRDTLWIDTRGPSNPSSGICSEGRVSLACETSYPQPRTRNPGRRTQSAHSRWITLNTSPRAARSIDRGIDERHTTAPRDCGER
jgi:hypothetical protein